MSVMVISALLPAATVPRLQLIVLPAAVHVPRLVVTDEIVAPVSLSLTVTGAEEGPRFATFTVYTALLPAMTCDGPLIVTAKSAGGSVGTTTVDGPDSGLLPTAFVAWTVNEYPIPFVRPVMTAEVPTTVTGAICAPLLRVVTV